MDFSLINKDYIRLHNFSSDGLYSLLDRSNVNYRLHPGDSLPIALEQQQTALRKEFVRLFHDCFNGNFTKLEARTGITEGSMRKYLRGNLQNRGRNISRMAIAKLVVGIPLDIEQAQKLFRLEGHSLEPECALLDAIVVDALQSGDDIQAFYETCAEFHIKT